MRPAVRWPLTTAPSEWALTNQSPAYGHMVGPPLQVLTDIQALRREIPLAEARR